MDKALTTQQPNAVAMVEMPINLPVLAGEVDMVEIQEALAANMEEGQSLQFPKIKMPTGGNLFWSIPTETEEPEMAKELIGVVLLKQTSNVYYEVDGAEKGKLPDCSSRDGKVGYPRESANGVPAAINCATCPKNQWGSKVKDGIPQKGKACKNVMNIAFLMEGSVFPHHIPITPGSLSSWTDYAKRLTTARIPKPIYGVVTKIKLVKVTNDSKLDYAQASFHKVADLTAAQKVEIKKFASYIEPFFRAVEVDAEDVYAEEEVAAATYQAAAGAGAGSAVGQAAAGSSGEAY